MHFSPVKIRILTKIQSRAIGYWTLRNWYANLWKTKPGKPPYTHVVQIGDPMLRTRCTEVPYDSIKSNEIQSLIKRLKYVMKKYNCVGLSAPQVGVNLRLFIVEFNRDSMKQFSKTEIKTKEMSLFPLTIIINPHLNISDYTKVVFPESCESVRGFSAEVPRYRSVELLGYNENGEKINVEAVGWTARIIQHEIDHLNGRIYTDVMDRESLTCSCWQAVNESKGKVVLPFRPD